MFRSNKIAIVADVHLGLKNASEKWHNFHIQWANFLKDECKKNNITDLVISGDFFHYRDEINVQTLHVANSILDIWKDLHIIMLTGNHDCYYKDNSSVNSLSIFKNRDNVKIIDSYTLFNQYNRNISMVPWGVSVKDITQSDVIFGHFNLISFKMSAGALCDHGDNPLELAKKAKHTFTGHFHIRQERTIDESRITYVGNPFQMDFGDLGDKKGYYELDLVDLSFEFRQYKDGPKFKRFKNDEYIDYKKYNKSICEVHLTEKWLLDKIKEKHSNIDAVDINMEVANIITDVRNYINSHNPIECKIIREPISNKKEKKKDVTKNISFDDVLKEMISSMNYSFEKELTDKLKEILK